MNPFGEPKFEVQGSASTESGQVLTYDELSYETRRTDLVPDVRDYADRLHAQIIDIYKKYGAKDVKEMFKNAKDKKGLKLEKKDVEEIGKNIAALESALKNNRMPTPELPTLEDFKNMIASVNAKIFPRKVRSLGDWSEYELIDGKMNGSIVTDDPNLVRLPVINGEAVEAINGKAIYGCYGVKNIDGKLNCTIRLGGSGGFMLPVINGELINKVPGVNDNIKECESAQNIDGKLNGAVNFWGSHRWYPVLNGNVIQELDGEQIYKFSQTQNVDGKLNGIVEFADGKHWLPVIGGELLSEVGGQKIQRCREARNIDGKLNGIVDLTDDRKLPVINGTLVESIGNQEIRSCEDVENIRGRLNGGVTLADGRTLPVIGGELVETVDGKRIANCYAVKNVGGRLNALIKFFGDLRCYPVISGKLIQSIQGQGIWLRDREFYTSYAGGVYSGPVCVDGTDGSFKQRHVLLGEFID